MERSKIFKKYIKKVCNLSFKKIKKEKFIKF